MHRFVWLLLLAVGLTSCQSASLVDEPQRVSAWGAVQEIAQAEQLHAPGLLPDPLRVGWHGIDESTNRLHHHVYLAEDRLLGETVTLPFNTTRPTQQRFAPGGDGRTHILWLDDNGKGETRLYIATLAANGQLERGAIEVSTAPTLSYSFVPAADGALWVVWNGGVTSEPALYAQFIDPIGRPRVPQQIRNNALWPALIEAVDGTHYLFWLSATAEGLYRGVLDNEALVSVTSLTDEGILRPGDRLIDFIAAVDETHAYVFWDLVKAGGTHQTWFTSGSHDAGSWPPAEGLFIGEVQRERVETGFDTPNPLAIEQGMRSVYHAAPLRSTSKVLPVAVQFKDRLVLLYFKGGRLFGYEDVVPLEADLLRPPILAADPDRNLYLAWTEPVRDAPARLYVVTSVGD